MNCWVAVQSCGTVDAFSTENTQKSVLMTQMTKDYVDYLNFENIQGNPPDNVVVAADT